MLATVRQLPRWLRRANCYVWDLLTGPYLMRQLVDATNGAMQGHERCAQMWEEIAQDAATKANEYLTQLNEVTAERDSLRELLGLPSDDTVPNRLEHYRSLAQQWEQNYHLQSQMAEGWETDARIYQKLADFWRDRATHYRQKLEERST